MHNHDHGHGIHIHADSNEVRFFIAILLNIIITLSEIIGGLLSKSLALLSDAFHNFSDVFALIISFVAIQIAKRQKDETKTFGYRRVEILAALFNIVTLILACSYIIYEAIKTFVTPHAINVNIMISIAVIGLLGNIFSVIILSKQSESNLNVKSAVLHLMGDTFSSVGVILAALIIIFFPKFYIIDPILSVLIVIYILKESISILMESVNILMQGTPKHINLNKIIKRLKSETKLSIIDVHHMHVWALSPTETILDCHVVVSEKNLQNINHILKEINNILVCDFKISHATIQFETKGFDHSVTCKL